jgi:hypothetical protein
MTVENRKMLMQGDLKPLKVLSTGDKTEMAENLHAQQIACYPRQSTAVFRFNRAGSPQPR